VADPSNLDGAIERLGADATLRLAIVSVEQSADAVYWFGEGGRVVFANEAASRALGYSRDELVGLLVTDLNPTYPADPATWRASIDSGLDDQNPQVPPWLKGLFAGTESQTYETVHRRKDGRLMPIEVCAVPIVLGGRRYVVAAARDISARRWMESAVRNIATELDKFFEVALEMLCITDQRGVFRRLNPSWERALGFNAAELTSRPLFDFVHLDDRGVTLDAFKQLVSRGTVVTFANRFEKKAGGYSWLQWRCVSDGDRIYAAVRDSTARTAGAAEAAPAHEAVHEQVRPTPPAMPTAAGTRADGATPGSTLRVLVVEDNRLNQRVARQMLEHLGIVVETAGDGREAVDAMRRGPDRFDAILMDMQMPEMDGLQATRVIRKEFPKHAVPIIAATASVDGTDMNACLDAGMNDYVSKPIEPRQLARVLSRWVPLPPPAGLQADRDAAPSTPIAAGQTPLRGIDINAALERLNGQHDLLVRLLRVFAQEHGRTTADIEAAMAREDFDGALRIVHNLKGVAGTLSATAVFDAARALESGLREGQRVSLPGMVDRLGKALDVVCRSVSEWTGATRSARADDTRREPDRQLAASLLDELDALLKSRRFSARPRFEQLKEQLALPELAPVIDEVQRCLDRLEFQQARELLPSIAAALGVPYPRG
jgi:PAS domain S-box-containing protein